MEFAPCLQVASFSQSLTPTDKMQISKMCMSLEDLERNHRGTRGTKCKKALWCRRSLLQLSGCEVAKHSAETSSSELDSQLLNTVTSQILWGRVSNLLPHDSALPRSAPRVAVSTNITKVDLQQLSWQHHNNHNNNIHTVM